MILHDNETRVDLLNAQPVAATIAKLLTSRPGTPVTIGIHGDWGAGKSSVLEMLACELASREEAGVLCVRFNGWRFQGFEDAKIALIEGIVEALIEARPALTKATEAVKDVYRRIDLLKVAKVAGSLAFTAFTGVPTPDIMNTVVGAFTNMLADPTRLLTADNLHKAIETTKSVLKPAEPKHLPEEVQEFLKAFNKLLETAKISQLVVLVDDLDRCLPKTAIETLEAIRLFVFTPKTAFVIAADEAMIEYAVREHFPDLPGSSGSRTYSQNYLEKLIQVPFRLPALGASETRIYVTLLLIGANVPDGDERFIKLTAAARTKLQRPWEGKTIAVADLEESFGKIPDEVRDGFALAEQIGPVLAEGTGGNPRQIKRFLNLLLLRRQMAEARGFAGDIKPQVLAKLMIAERFHTTLFDQIVRLANQSASGVLPEIAALEKLAAKQGGQAPTVPAATTPAAQMPEDWEKSDLVHKWAQLKPSLAGENLKPYLFLTRDRRGYFDNMTVLGQLGELAERLCGPSLVVAALDGDLKKLAHPELAQLAELLRARILSAENFMTEPPGTAGLKMVLKAHPPSQSMLLDMLEQLPGAKLGTWVMTGWDASITDQAQKARYRALQAKWAKLPNNPALSAAAKAIPKLSGGQS